MKVKIQQWKITTIAEKSHKKHKNPTSKQIGHHASVSENQLVCLSVISLIGSFHIDLFRIL